MPSLLCAHRFAHRHLVACACAASIALSVNLEAAATDRHSLPTASPTAMNSLHVIAPYKYHGMWVFDDARVGLDREPFVSGADTMIDRAVANIPDADRGFLLVFSATPFPGHQITLDWTRGDAGGNWYFSRELDMEGWLCPALFKYFTEAPSKIHVRVEPRKERSTT